MLSVEQNAVCAFALLALLLKTFIVPSLKGRLDCHCQICAVYWSVFRELGKCEPSLGSLEALLAVQAPKLGIQAPKTRL